MSVGPDGLLPPGSALGGTRDERLAGVEREIRQAKAEALGRAGERLQGVLERLAAMDLEIDRVAADQGPAPPALRARLDARNRVREEALRVRHYLIVQREALGLARHSPVDECYPVPGRRELPEPLEARGRTP